MLADVDRLASSFRTGYVSLLLPASSPEREVPALIRQLVIDALSASAEWPARIEVITHQRVHNHGVRGGSDQDRRMKRWFVEYVTGPADAVPEVSVSKTALARG